MNPELWAVGWYVILSRFSRLCLDLSINMRTNSHNGAMSDPRGPREEQTRRQDLKNGGGDTFCVEGAQFLLTDIADVNDNEFVKWGAPPPPHA